MGQIEKLKEILLVDDSKGTNSLNKRLLQKMGIVEKISTALNGRLALDYLTLRNQEGNYPSPNIIFLDINMPVMDGYQFLEEYNKLEEEKKAGWVVVMLTSSVADSDKEKTSNNDRVKGYLFKPLTEEGVREIIKQVL